MAKHVTTCTDEEVRLVRGGTSMGTVARCTCGWVSSWWVRDGSAEADAHYHVRTYDAEYNAECEANEAEDRKRRDLEAKVEPVVTERVVVDNTHGGSDHGCTCFQCAPCGACEYCNHWGLEEGSCELDCQTCEYDHQRSGPYKLEDGDDRWSDGVVRHWGINSMTWRVHNSLRTSVVKDDGVWCSVNGWHSKWKRFDTFEEAIADADYRARNERKQ